MPGIRRLGTCNNGGTVHKCVPVGGTEVGRTHLKVREGDRFGLGGLLPKESESLRGDVAQEKLESCLNHDLACLASDRVGSRGEGGR